MRPKSLIFKNFYLPKTLRGVQWIQINRKAKYIYIYIYHIVQRILKVKIKFITLYFYMKQTDKQNCGI